MLSANELGELASAQRFNEFAEVAKVTPAASPAPVKWSTVAIDRTLGAMRQQVASVVSRLRRLGNMTRYVLYEDLYSGEPTARTIAAADSVAHWMAFCESYELGVGEDDLEAAKDRLTIIEADRALRMGLAVAAAETGDAWTGHVEFDDETLQHLRLAAWRFAYYRWRERQKEKQVYEDNPIH